LILRPGGLRHYSKRELMKIADWPREDREIAYRHMLECAECYYGELIAWMIQRQE